MAFPTETVYGLGANALDATAVARVFAAKERAADDPLIVHVAAVEELALVAADLPPAARLLADRFWPGPLTLVLARTAAVAPAVSAGLETVAVRMPAHPVAAALIHAAGVPVAAPSANRFTRTSATTAAHVLDDLRGRIDLVLDGGPADVGVESTVVDARGPEVCILRPGALTAEAIAAALAGLPGTRLVEGTPGPGPAASPGMMTRHYAPRAWLVYVRQEGEAASARLDAFVAEALAAGRKVGLLLASDDLARFPPRPGLVAFDLGPRADLRTVARRLYAGLRTLDAAGVELIAVRGFGQAGLARALDDRLRRAAAEVVED